MPNTSEHSIVPIHSSNTGAHSQIHDAEKQSIEKFKAHLITLDKNAKCPGILTEETEKVIKLINSHFNKKFSVQALDKPEKQSEILNYINAYLMGSKPLSINALTYDPETYQRNVNTSVFYIPFPCGKLDLNTTFKKPSHQ